MKLSEEKRNQFIMVALLTGGVLAGLYFGLIRSQQQGLTELNDSRATARDKLDLVRQAIHNQQLIETELDQQNKLLATQEKDMAAGDLYLWMINFITRFNTGYGLNIPQFDKGGDSTEVKLLPKFPYKQVTVPISGTGYYHDIGRFVADFENRFPGSRVLNLDLQPGPVQVREEREKLSFKMEIVTLVKSSSM